MGWVKSIKERLADGLESEGIRLPVVANVTPLARLIDLPIT